MSYEPAIVATFPPVPAGMVRLCEPGNLPKGTHAVRQIIEEGEYTNPHGVKFPAKLWFKPRGFTSAGSMMRWDDKDTWGVSMEDRNGSTFGKSFLTESEAREYWDTTRS